MYGPTGLTYLLGEEENGRPPTLVPVVLEYESAFAEGARLRGHVWLPPAGSEVKSVVLACHGYNHYIGNALYTRLASELCSEGIALLGLTLEGHGRSGGLLAWIRGFDFLVQQELEFYDLCCGVAGSPVATLVDTRGKRLGAGSSVLPLVSKTTPLAALGESMGGALALKCCMARPAAFAAVVLIAPMCGIEASMLPHPCLFALGQLVARCVPTAPIAPMRDTLPLCFRDPGKLALVLRDGVRYTGRTRIGTGIELCAASLSIAARPRAFDRPVLCFHGSEDVMTSPTASRRFFEECASKDKTYIEVPGGRHSLWWEPLPTRKAMLADIVRFVLTRSAGVTTPASAVIAFPERSGPFHVPPGRPFSTEPASSPPSDWPGFDTAPGTTLPERLGHAHARATVTGVAGISFPAESCPLLPSS